MRICSTWHGFCSGQTEIGKFQHTVIVEKQILGFEVSVQNFLAMTKVEPSQQLKKEQFDIDTIQSIDILLQILAQIHFHVFENKSELMMLIEDVVEGDNVGVTEIPEKGCLTDRREWKTLLELEFDLFEGDDRAVEFRFTLVHCRIRSLAELINPLVQIIHVLRGDLLLSRQGYGIRIIMSTSRTSFSQMGEICYSTTCGRRRHSGERRDFLEGYCSYRVGWVVGTGTGLAAQKTENILIMMFRSTSGSGSGRRPIDLIRVPRLRHFCGAVFGVWGLGGAVCLVFLLLVSATAEGEN